MRLFSKIFLCNMFVISIGLLFAGYLTITLSLENAINHEMERAANQFQYDKFTVQSKMLSSVENNIDDITSIISLRKISSELSGLAAFYTEDKTLLYSELPELSSTLIEAGFSNTIHDVRISKLNDRYYTIARGTIEQSEIKIHLIVATDISDIITQKDHMILSFKKIYFMTLFICLVITLILSLFITKPLKMMTRTVSKIANGNYRERLGATSNDEIGELSKSVNLMADAIEEKMIELTENTRKRDDFIASFSHELKTPLTSIIGFADMLYQKKLQQEQVEEVSSYILNEGLRLESLYIKLMDLVVLNRRDFILEELRADELLLNITDSLRPLFLDKNVVCNLKTDSAFIMVEFDLFKTLVLNLIDNAIKAGSTTIKITGKQEQKFYSICIIDNGCGIPSSEINRITEAFYMIDKSRSRKNHGVGLGLALVSRIAEIHDAYLEITSKVDIGTAINLKFKILARSIDDE